MSNKFVIGDHVRVTNPLRDEFDRTGVVTGYAEIQCEPASKVMLTGTDLELIFRHTSLTLADPDVHTVLDQMDKESAPVEDVVNAPSHYRSHPSGIETITITRHESFLRGNLLKYVLRAPYKGSEVEDLKKAAVYLQWEIERAEAAQ